MCSQLSKKRKGLCDPCVDHCLSNITFPKSKEKSYFGQMSITGPIAVSSLGTNGELQLILNQIHQGTGNDQRLGRKVFLKKLTYSVDLLPYNPNFSFSSPYYVFRHRLMIVNPPTNASVAWSSFFPNSSDYAHIGPNITNRESFPVLHDTRGCHSIQAYSFGDYHFNPSYIKSHTYSIDLNMTSEYEDTAGLCKINPLYLLLMSDTYQKDDTLTYFIFPYAIWIHWRVDFIDL